MSKSEVVEDFLEVDQPIPGQNFVCLSFISPDKVLKRKETIIVKEFAKWFLKDLKSNMDPSKLDPEKLTPEFIDTLNVNDKFDDFLYANEDKINQKFNDDNDFQMMMREEDRHPRAPRSSSARPAWPRRGPQHPSQPTPSPPQKHPPAWMRYRQKEM